MAYKFEIIGSALVVSDTVTLKVLVDTPKRDAYYNTIALTDEKKIELYDTNGVAFNGAILGDQYFLSESQDSAGVTFTDATFRAFARANLGYNDISGDVSAAISSTMKYGAQTFVLDGVTTVFNIPHGLGSDPASFQVTFADAANLNFVQSTRTKNATNITFTCADPPAAGSQTVYWVVYK